MPLLGPRGIRVRRGGRKTLYEWRLWGGCGRERWLCRCMRHTSMGRKNGEGPKERMNVSTCKESRGKGDVRKEPSSGHARQGRQTGAPDRGANGVTPVLAGARGTLHAQSYSGCSSGAQGRGLSCLRARGADGAERSKRCRSPHTGVEFLWGGVGRQAHCLPASGARARSQGLTSAPAAARGTGPAAAPPAPHRPPAATRGAGPAGAGCAAAAAAAAALRGAAAGWPPASAPPADAGTGPRAASTAAGGQGEEQWVSTGQAAHCVGGAL